MSARWLTELTAVMRRDLDTLEAEVAAYPDDDALWREAEGIANPGGTLAIHLAGGLLHFVGALLGGTAYVRDRAAEFGERGLSREEVIRRIGEARDAVSDVVPNLDPQTMEHLFEGAPGGREATRAFVLLHLASHLAYHLGQVNYHRRLVGEGSPGRRE